MVKKASTPQCVGTPKVRKPRKARAEGFPAVAEARQEEAKPGNKNKRQTVNLFYQGISEATGLETKDVKATFDALSEFIITKLRDDGRVTIPKIVLLRLKDTKARPATTRKVLGKEIHVAATPAGKKRLHALVQEPLKVAVSEIQ